LQAEPRLDLHITLSAHVTVLVRVLPQVAVNQRDRVDHREVRVKFKQLKGFQVLNRVNELRSGVGIVKNVVVDDCGYPVFLDVLELSEGLKAGDHRLLNVALGCLILDEIHGPVE